MSSKSYPQPEGICGNIEPHAELLKAPPDEQLLYKIMSVENLLRSVEGNYLHFNRVDSYRDFTGADPHDGQQLPKDQQNNARSKFMKAPEFSVADYYDKSRARTFACCFSLENSDFIWENYANGSKKGKVGIIFNFGNLKKTINRTLRPGNSVIQYNGDRIHQIFSVNYGFVEYIDWNNHQAGKEYLPNPIIYTFMKDIKYSDEREFRISLSALGIGEFAVSDGLLDFPDSLQLDFDFKAAINCKVIQKILHDPSCDKDFLQTELNNLGINLN